MAELIDLEVSPSQSEFADLVGVSQKTISLRIKEGKLSRGGSYRTLLREYIASLSKEAAGRVHDNDKTLLDQKLAESQQKTLQLAIANSKELGALVSIEEAAGLINAVFSEVSGELNNAAVLIQERLESELSMKINDELVFEPIHAAASGIANVARKFGEDLSSGTGEIDATLAAIHS